MLSEAASYTSTSQAFTVLSYRRLLIEESSRSVAQQKLLARQHPQTIKDLSYIAIPMDFNGFQ